MCAIVSSVGDACCDAIADSGVSKVLSITRLKNNNFPVPCWTNFFPFASMRGDSLGVSLYWTVAPHVGVARIYGDSCRRLGGL